MKTYLSHNERQIATYFSINLGMINVLLDNYAKNLSKEEITNLKYAYTYLTKYVKALVERVGNAEGDRIYRLATTSKLSINPKSLEDKQVVVDKDDMEEVARMALEKNCFGCERKDWQNCGLCKLMDRLGVGSVNDTKGKCEFYYEKKED